jgi:hypothetical protein
MTSAWEPLLTSVTKRRSYDARFYKPVCLIAVIDAVSDGAVAVSDIDPQQVMDRFADYVAPLFPDRAGMGWRPFWHLSNDGAWRFRKNGRLVGPEDFGQERKPNSRGRLLSSIDHVAVSSAMRSTWRDASARAELRRAVLMMLEADDIECRAMANVLRGDGQTGLPAIETNNVARSGRQPAGGQGFLASAAARLAVERRAMSLAQAHLEGLGWAVEDVSAYESFDLLCRRKDGDILYVEVKGSTGAGDQIQITRSEVAFAEVNTAKMALIVVADIVLRSNASTVVAEGGRVAMLHPWSADPSRLTAISYVYRLERAHD